VLERCAALTTRLADAERAMVPALKAPDPNGTIEARYAALSRDDRRLFDDMLEEASRDAREDADNLARDVDALRAKLAAAEARAARRWLGVEIAPDTTPKPAAPSAFDRDVARWKQSPTAAKAYAEARAELDAHMNALTIEDAGRLACERDEEFFRNARLRDVLQDARNDLERYGKHGVDCEHVVGEPCDCGLADVIARMTRALEDDEAASRANQVPTDKKEQTR